MFTIDPSPGPHQPADVLTEIGSDNVETRKAASTTMVEKRRECAREPGPFLGNAP